MTRRQRLRVMGAIVAFSVVVIFRNVLASPRGKADDRDDSESRIERGFEIAPVPLKALAE